jgi:hypothetical protein
MRCTRRWLKLMLSLCLMLALPLQGLAAVSGLPGCPHHAPVQQPVAEPPCHQASADLAADAATEDGAHALNCVGCTACMGWTASAPAPAHPAVAALPGPGQAPVQRLGLPAQPGFAHGLERPPRAA